MTLPYLLDGTVSEATSSYPYQTVGPIDFSNTNFVNTCQTDYYYNESSTPPQLLSEVKQCSYPMEQFWSITVIVFLVIGMMFLFGWLFVFKKSKSVEEAFNTDTE